jgi:hypothetical protein
VAAAGFAYSAMVAVAYGVSTPKPKAARLPAISALTVTCSPGANGVSGTKLAPSPCE